MCAQLLFFTSLVGCLFSGKRNTQKSTGATDYGSNYLGGKRGATSASPRGGKQEGKERCRRRKKKEECRVKESRVCARLAADCCHNWGGARRSALSVVGNRRGLDRRAGLRWAPAPSLGFGSSEAMGWGSLIGPSGQCAAQPPKFRRTLPVPHLGATLRQPKSSPSTWRAWRSGPV